jgi:hypothetical protein
MHILFVCKLIRVVMNIAEILLIYYIAEILLIFIINILGGDRV